MPWRCDVRLQVAFRPNTRQTHIDELELVTGSSIISVRLSAVLPASKLQLPPAVDFGCVPVRQSCVQQVPIKNVGDAGLLFSWKLEEPFAVVPAAGQLAADQTMICEVRLPRWHRAIACTVHTMQCTNLVAKRAATITLMGTDRHWIWKPQAVWDMGCVLAGALPPAGGSCIQGGSSMQLGQRGAADSAGK